MLANQAGNYAPGIRILPVDPTGPDRRTGRKAGEPHAVTVPQDERAVRYRALFWKALKKVRANKGNAKAAQEHYRTLLRRYGEMTPPMRPIIVHMQPEDAA